jgi:hypothetical protein
MADVIKEFLVSLGFKTDAIGIQDFQNAIKISSNMVANLGDELEKISKKYESLSYGSERTGTTVQNLQAVAYAASRVGMSAEEGAAAMEAFAEAIRKRPAIEDLVGKYGVIQTDKAKEFISFIKGVKKELGDTKMGYAVAWQVAELAGIPEHSFAQMFKYTDKFEEKFNEFGKRQAESGFDPEAFSKKSVKFQDSVAGLVVSLTTMKEIFYSGFIEPAQTAVEWLDKLTIKTNQMLSITSDQHHERLKERREKFRSGINNWLGEKIFPDLPESERPTPPASAKPAATPVSPTANASQFRAAESSIHIPADPTERRKFVADFYMREGGYSPEVAWAWAGNLHGETANFNPAEGGGWIRGRNGQLHKEDSYGIGQWHKERRDDFKNWSGHEMQGTDLLEQLRFSLYESTQGRYKAVGEHLKNAKTVRDAMRILVSEYERPADIPGNIRSRGDTAETWFQADLGRSRGWGARTEPTDEQRQADASARNATAEGSSASNIAQHNNLAIHINGIAEPEKLRGAMRDGADELTRHLMIRLDSMR